MLVPAPKFKIGFSLTLSANQALRQYGLEVSSGEYDDVQVVVLAPAKPDGSRGRAYVTRVRGVDWERVATDLARKYRIPSQNVTITQVEGSNVQGSDRSEKPPTR